MMGQRVPFVKHSLSRDKLSRSYQNLGMAAKSKRVVVPKTWVIDFAKRLHAARVATQKNQEDFAIDLGITIGSYKHYELDPDKKKNRVSMMPVHLIPKVCELTGLSLWSLMTGQTPAMEPCRRGTPSAPSQEQINPNHSQGPPPAIRKRPKRKAA